MIFNLNRIGIESCYIRENYTKIKFTIIPSDLISNF